MQAINDFSFAKFCLRERLLKRAACCLVLLVSAGCGKGGGTNSKITVTTRNGATSADFDCDGSCQNLNLSAGEVSTILAQGVRAAQSLGVNATFAVTDRVGNVLAVYQMAGAAGTTRIDGKLGASGGLEGLSVPSTLAAISKAGTGAFLSSQGNAFSTRTANQIVQENFNPGERNQPGGPLFGVQFSQLLCGDVTVLNPDFAGGISSGAKPRASGLIGPRHLPLGLSPDPGGIPLYTLGDLVGGIGVEFDGEYRLDRDVSDFDDDPEERIAMQASIGFEAPSDRVASRMNVGKSLRYTDLDYSDLEPLAGDLPALDPAGFQVVPFYANGAVRDGAVFGDPASGVVETVRAGVAAAFLVDGSGGARFPTRAGSGLPGGEQLSGAEVDAILDSALNTAQRGRAAIRRPLDTPVRVSIWVIDHLGIPLGFVRSQDAPVFGIDVALQKARGVALMSSPDAGDILDSLRASNAVGAFENYTGAARAFVGAGFLTGTHAISDRAIGNLARPFFPDGINGNINGPFSLPHPESGAVRTWSPFNDGLQLDLIFQRLAQTLGIPQNPPGSLPDACVNRAVAGSRAANGIQIFPGAVPLYRGRTLIGAIGISGDGIDQDDLTAFYGASRRGLDFVGHVGVGDPALGFNAPIEIRSDQIDSLPFENVRLRYVNCPEGPFSGSNEQNVCDGL